MKIFRVIIISITTIFICTTTSCKKEKLKFIQYENESRDLLTGDTAVFVGSWNWIYTDHDYGWCSGDSYYELLSPVTESKQFDIVFYQSGYLSYYKNDSLISQYRISFQYIDFNANSFVIDLDGFSDLNLSGYFSTDTLMCYVPGFLFYEELGCESYHNYFKKN